jgi:predicted DNA-binding transcriptional regulator AlpA
MGTMSSSDTTRQRSGGDTPRDQARDEDHINDEGVTRSSRGRINACSGDRHSPEFVSIPVWCRRVDCSRDTGYRLARRGQIPGQFRIGTLLRVNWDVFVRSTESERPET